MKTIVLIAATITLAIAGLGCGESTPESPESRGQMIGSDAAREARTREEQGQSPAEAEAQALDEIHEREAAPDRTSEGER